MQQRQEVAGLPVSLGLRPAPLAGREELLADLDVCLSGGHGEPRIVVLYGLAGVGKTAQTTRDNLAASTGEAGDAASARDQYAALLPIRERVLGPEHPDTLTTRGNLSYWTNRARSGRKRGTTALG